MNGSEALPHRWSDEELEKDRQKAIDIFIDERLGERKEDYLEKFCFAKGLVVRLFERTNSLLGFSGETIREKPELIEPARFLAAPPISQDDLNTLVRENIVGRKEIPHNLAKRAARVIRDILDPIRFSWINEGRPPTEEEKTKAIEWTAGIWAIQLLRTERRMESSVRQEEAVKEVLRSKGWVEEQELRRIETGEDIDRLSPGAFASRIYVKGSECNVVIRLYDGRLLALECKVSNSSVNSIKRLVHEVGDKASSWMSYFSNRIIPGAVLSGVYKLRHLKVAQDERNISIFWEHDLKPLAEFLDDVASSRTGKGRT